MPFTKTRNSNNAVSQTKAPRPPKTARPRLFEMSSLESRTLWSATLTGYALEFPLNAPLHSHATSAHPTVAAAHGLTATLQPSNTIQLNWTDDGNASGYMVMLSVDNGGYMGIAITTGATTYTSPPLTPGHTYSYEVVAYGNNELGTPSNAASITIGYPLPPAPTGLSDSGDGAFINVSWNASQYATGYNIFRSTDGANFAKISHQLGGAGFTDSTVIPGHTYQYEVRAFCATGMSPLSAPISFTAPPAPAPTGVTISTRFGDELVITAAGQDDSISVAETGTTLNITADGKSYTDPAPAAGLFIYTRGGADSIALAGSLTAQTTVETIDAAVTTISSSAPNVGAWIDTNDIYTGAGVVHRVNAFAGSVSKATGASLANPSDSGTTRPVNLSLFGDGPVIGDVRQGEVGDCYFMSSLAAFAEVKPSVLTNSVVDMGDGTYVVQFMTGNTPTFVRVNNAFSTGGFGGYAYAYPGADNTIWPLVFEKAFCEFRSGANTYASISGGWMSEVYSDLGVNNTSFTPASYSASTFYTLVSNALSSADAMTLATPASAPALVGDHCYTLLGCSLVNGVPMFKVRNPWGSSGDSLENNRGIALLTFAQVTANFTSGTQALA